MHAQDEERPPIATEDGVEIRPAFETLARLRDGRVLDLLAIEINRVVTGVKNCSDPKKGGTVTLTLKVDRVKKLPNAVYIEAKVAGKAPEDPPPNNLFFFDDDGNLHTRDPLQRDIFDDGPRGV